MRDKSSALTTREVSVTPKHNIEKRIDTMFVEPVYAPVSLTGGGKSFTVTTRDAGAIPEDTIEKHRHTMIAEPVNVMLINGEKSQTIKSQYQKNSVANICEYHSTYEYKGSTPNHTIEKHERTMIAEPVLGGQ